MKDKIELFSKIKELSSEPPMLDDDLYFERSPWRGIADIYPGICMGARWASEYYIEHYASYEDLEAIYRYILENREE